jgi:hypothetical protein
MKMENRWTHGTTNLVLPALPADLKDRHGFNLHHMTTERRHRERIAGSRRCRFECGWRIALTGENDPTQGICCSVTFSWLLS